MRKIQGSVIVLLAFMSLGPAFGQNYRTFDAELNEVRTDSRLRIGPLRFIPAFNLVNVGYDDNVYFRSAGEKPVGDYVGTASLDVKAYLLLGRSLILSFTENPEYQYFAEEKPLRKFTNSYEPAARLRLFNRLVFSGSYHFLKHQRRAFSEFTSLVTDTDKGEQVSAFYETPRGSAIGYSRAVKRFRYEDIFLPESEILFSNRLNRKETTGTLELYYPVFAESTFFVTAGSTRYRFDHPGSRWKDSGSVQGSAGLRFPLMGRARGRISLGYKSFVPDSKNRKGFSGLVADTDVDFRFRRLGFKFGLGRDNRFSYLEDVLFYIEDGVSSGLSFRLNRRFRLDYEIKYQALKYPEPFPVHVPGGEPLEIARRDIHRTHSFGISVFIHGNTGVHLSYNIYERTSNVPGFERGKNFIGVSLIRDY